MTQRVLNGVLKIYSFKQLESIPTDGLQNSTKVTEIHAILPATVTDPFESITPLFGLTQYRFGAVVFTLKHTLLSEGFVNFRSAVTTSLNGPKNKSDNEYLLIYLCLLKYFTS